MLLHGIFPPITTPFYPDGNVYHKKLEANVERYSRTPSAGIVVQGSTGEAILLSDQERRDVLKTALSAAAPSKVMIAGTGVESAHETLKLTEYAAELGYDAALVRTPHFYKKQMLPANMLAFYRTVADRSPLPILIYNFPGATGYDISAELVVELASHPNIVGIKESGGNLEKVKTMIDGTRHIKRSATVTDTFEAVTPRMLKAAAADNSNGGQLVSVETLGGAAKPSSSAVTIVGKLKTRQKEVGFQVLVGAAHQLEPSLALGAVGAIVAFAPPTAPAAAIRGSVHGRSLADFGRRIAFGHPTGATGRNLGIRRAYAHDMGRPTSGHSAADGACRMARRPSASGAAPRTRRANRSESSWS